MNPSDTKTPMTGKSMKPTNPISASQIKTGTSVLCSNDGKLGVVDHMQGAATIKLNKDDKGVHHFIPLSWVRSVDDKLHLDRPGEQAMKEWSVEPPRT